MKLSISPLVLLLVAVATVLAAPAAAQAGDRFRCDEAAIAKEIAAIAIAPIGVRAEKAAAIATRHCKKIDRRIGDRLTDRAGGAPVTWAKVTGVAIHWPRACKRHRKIDMYLHGATVSEANLTRVFTACQMADAKVFTQKEFVLHQDAPRLVLALMTFFYLRDHGVSHRRARSVARMMSGLEP